MTAAAAAAEAATLNVTGLWKDALNELKFQMTQATFNQWLKGSQGLRLDGNCLVIQVGNEYAVDWLENRLKPTIVRTVCAIADRPELEVRFQVGGEVAPTAPLAVGSRSPDLIVSAGGVVSGAANGHGQVNGTAVEQAEEPEPEQTIVTPPPARVARPGGAGSVQIEIRAGDPTYGFLAVSHYAQMFWRPFVGLVPFTVWEVLCSYAFHVQRYGRAWPNIEMLSDSLGYGTRATILGRAATSGNPAQRGAVDTLQEHRLIRYWTEGEGRQTSYHFRVHEQLPVLSLYQVRKLSKRKQEEHAEYVSYFKSFDMEKWAADDRETFIPEWD